MRISSHEARAILHRIGVARGADYYTLRSSESAALSDEAIARGYRAPRNASGSTARYFHDHLQRLAAKAPALRWSVSAGRWLHFDGKPVFALHRTDGAGSPVQLDSLAHIVANLLNGANVTPDSDRPVLTAWCDPANGWGGVS